MHDGRSVLFYLKGHSVAPNVSRWKTLFLPGQVGCLSVRSSVLALQAVPLGAVIDKETKNDKEALRAWSKRWSSPTVAASLRPGARKLRPIACRMG